MHLCPELFFYCSYFFSDKDQLCIDVLIYYFDTMIWEKSTEIAYNIAVLLSHIQTYQYHTSNLSIFFQLEADIHDNCTKSLAGGLSRHSNVTCPPE